jgi:hypothetical protein
LKRGDSDNGRETGRPVTSRQIRKYRVKQENKPQYKNCGPKSEVLELGLSNRGTTKRMGRKLPLQGKIILVIKGVFKQILHLNIHEENNNVNSEVRRFLIM